MLTEASHDLEALRLEIARQETDLRDSKQTPFADAAAETAALRARADSLCKALGTLADGRCDAAARIGQLTKAQLSEIKRLMRNPPKAVRRILAACWLILHSDHIHEKGGDGCIHFDDNLDWHRCQRMMVDAGFVSRIIGFDPSRLDEAPFLVSHVASTYLGLQHEPLPRQAASPNRGATKPKLPTLVQNSNHCTVQSLSLDVVSRASKPCGSLFRWLQAVVTEHMERVQLRHELGVVETDIVHAENRESLLRVSVAEAEQALQDGKAYLADKEKAFTELQQEEAATREAAAKLIRMESLPCSRPATKAEKRRASPVAAKMNPVVADMIEVEVSMTLAAVEAEVSRLRIDFNFDDSTVLDGDPRQALNLPKIAAILNDHRGKLKLLIEGHHNPDECSGTDVQRARAVFQWLVDVACCSPALLRIKGLGTSQGMGQCAVPVPIQELVTRQGPCIPELQKLQASPGIHFSFGHAQPATEVQAILKEVSRCLVADEHIVRIEGHSDKSEDVELAMQRSKAVRDFLLKAGVDSQQLHLASCGALHPISRRHASMNCRVEIQLD